jgi:hypothetical protein
MKSLAIALLAVLPLAVGCAKAKVPVSKVGFVQDEALTATTTSTLVVSDAPFTTGGTSLILNNSVWDGTTAVHEPILEVWYFISEMGEAQSIELNLDSFDETCAEHGLSLHVKATHKGRKLVAFCGKEY